MVQYELSRPLSVEDIPFGPPFRGLSLTTGIAVFPEMLELIDVLHLYGFSVWAEGHVKSYVKARSIAALSEFTIGQPPQNGWLSMW